MTGQWAMGTKTGKKQKDFFEIDEMETKTLWKLNRMKKSKATGAKMMTWRAVCVGLWGKC